MRTEDRANLEMRCLFRFENIAICDAIHAVLIENEKFLLGITKYNVFYKGQLRYLQNKYRAWIGFCPIHAGTNVRIAITLRLKWQRFGNGWFNIAETFIYTVLDVSSKTV